MNNKLKSKTRIAFIQLIFQHLSTNNNINDIFDIFNSNYKSTYFEDFLEKKKIKFEFNSLFLKKLISFYVTFINSINYLDNINKYIEFDRKFEKWDLINRSIFLASISEINNSNKEKIKIILNDYLNIGKLFITKNDLRYINAILDKIIKSEK